MSLFLECKPDETLAKTLGVARSVIIHSDDKGGVCKRLLNSIGMKGMIDEDPMSAQPKYLKELREQEKRYGVSLLVDGQRLHRIVVLCPRLEDWFLKLCKAGGIDVARYGLPDNPNRLHEQINFRLGNFQKVVQELVRLQNPAILHLQSLLLSE